MPRPENITSIRDRIMTTKPTPRVERLKETFMNTEPRIEIDSERIYTRVMKETDGDPMAIRRAKAFYALVREMPINIASDELFVGYINTTWAGYRVSTESGPPTMEEVLEYAKRRRSVISDDVDEQMV